MKEEKKWGQMARVFDKLGFFVFVFVFVLCVYVFGRVLLLCVYILFRKVPSEVLVFVVIAATFIAPSETVDAGTKESLRQPSSSRSYFSHFNSSHTQPSRKRVPGGAYF
jgi:hypothetical protein